MTYGDAGRNEIALVQDEQEMFVRGFLFDVLFHTPAACTFRIPRVQDVDDDVRRVNDFV